MSPKSLFVCQSCGNEFPKWAGKCSGCGQWNTLVETARVSATGNKKQGTRGKASAVKILNLNSQELVSGSVSRVTSGISEFDRVLGSGFVPGQAILLAGEPGIGKSTLLLQIASKVENGKLKMESKNGLSEKIELSTFSSQGGSASGGNSQLSTVLYVCGEESPSQIQLRASRLGISGDNINLLAETDVDSLLNVMESGKWKVESSKENNSQLSPPKADPPRAETLNFQLLIIDSIQTLVTSDLASAQGSVAQVKECTSRILNFVKARGIPTILIGHVNKDGDIAGPKVLEHMVDTVMYLEGERFGSLRLLRCIKNRFGDVGEVGVFQMSDKGFSEVKNPSAAFIEERSRGSGSVITVTMEGTRPVLVEVQALVSKSSFNYPKRSSSGFDLNRLYFICAVIEKHLKIPLQGFDVYVNVTSGAKISEPSADLAVALAIVSSFKNKAASPKTVVFGELGLSGEVRSVGSEKRRELEAKKLGFTNVVSPAQTRTLSEAVRLAL